LLNIDPQPQNTPERSGTSYKKPSERLSHLRVSDEIKQAISAPLLPFPVENSNNSLEIYRNKYALRLHKGLAEAILKHPHARAIFIYLELKPLFISSVLFNERGKLPYNKISEFIGEGKSTIRKKIATLKRLKLVRVDRKKNLHLASYDKLADLFSHHTKRKHKLLNNGTTGHLVKTVAIYENMKRQEYTRNKKILERELFLILSEKQQLDPINSNVFLPTAKGCEKYFSKRFIRNYSKMIKKNLPAYIAKWDKIYDRQILQTEFKFPDVNPNVTLSCKGIARVINRKAQSSGYYQARKIVHAGLLQVSGQYQLIPDVCPAINENDYGLRTDIYSYVYRTRRNATGLKRMYFRTLPNLLTPLENAFFY